MNKCKVCGGTLGEEDGDGFKCITPDICNRFAEIMREIEMSSAEINKRMKRTFRLNVIICSLSLLLVLLSSTLYTWTPFSIICVLFMSLLDCYYIVRFKQCVQLVKKYEQDMS
jgi:hypothetical protein